MHKVYDPKLQWNPDVQYDIEEYCPECGNMIAVEIDRGDSRFFVTCPVCGRKLLLCSMCAERCDWNEETGCHMKDRKVVWDL